MNRLHFKGRNPRVVDAEKAATIRLSHPSRLGDGPDKKPAFQIKHQRQRPKKTLSPERKTGSLIDPVDLLDARPNDCPAMHELRHENLAGERPKLASGAVVSRAVDGFRPTIGNPHRGRARRLGGQLGSRRIWITVIDALDHLAQPVGRNPIALIVREKDIPFRSGRPTKSVAETVGNFCCAHAVRPGLQPQNSSHAGQIPVIGVWRKTKDERPRFVTHQPVGPVITVPDILPQPGHPLEPIRDPVAVQVLDAGEIAAMEKIQTLAVVEHRVRILK